MTLRVTERSIETARGPVRVRLSGDSIVVTWSCGDQAAFTAEGIKEAMEHLRTMSRAFDMGEVWYEVTTRYGRKHQVRLTNDNLHVGGGGGFAYWPDLRKAIKLALKEAK